MLIDTHHLIPLLNEFSTLTRSQQLLYIRALQGAPLDASIRAIDELVHRLKTRRVLSKALGNASRRRLLGLREDAQITAKDTKYTTNHDKKAQSHTGG